MNNKELLHNIVMALLLFVMLAGMYLIMLWRSYPENQILDNLANLLCGSSLVFLGGFLLFFSNAVKDRFIKESFLKYVMNEKEKTVKIFTFGAYAFGAIFFFSGLISIISRAFLIIGK